MKNKLARLFVLLALSSAALSGCSSSTTYTTITIDGVEYQIENVGDTLVIGMECNYAPFNWTASSANEYTVRTSNGTYADGYDVQISKLLGEYMGLSIQIVPTNWESLIADVQLGNLDLILAGMTDTETRRNSIDFSDEYYHSDVVLIYNLSNSDAAAYSEDVILGDEELSTLLNGAWMISQSDTVEDDIIDTFVDAYGAHHSTPTTTYASAAYDVSQGSADFLVCEAPVGQAYVSSFGNLGILNIDQNILGVDLSSLGVSIGLHKGYTGLCDALNAALNKISQETRETLMMEAVQRNSGE